MSEEKSAEYVTLIREREAWRSAADAIERVMGALASESPDDFSKAVRVRDCLRSIESNLNGKVGLICKEANALLIR